MTRYISLISVFILPLFLMAQSGHFSVSLTPGIMYYQGDLSGSPTPDIRTTHLSAGVDVGYRFSDIFLLNFGYQYGNISGADSLVPSHAKRNLHFTSVIHDVNVKTYIDVLAIVRHFKVQKTVGKSEWKRSFSGPNIILGMSMIYFNPKAELDGKEYDLQRIGTEGQYLSTGSYPSPYSKFQFGFKYGLGMGYYFSKRFHTELQFIYTQVFTDYLDDVSGKYPDPADVTNSDDAELTAYFAYGGRNPNEFTGDSNRGNSSRNDGFLNVGIKLTYIFGKSEFKRVMNL